MRILQLELSSQIKQVMHDMKVDPYGIDIMLPKAIHYLIKINSISNITANILKQEMLSLGGEAAIARDALTGKSKKTDCLLMGNLSQLRSLNKKLNRQPFGLDKLAKELSLIEENYLKEKFTIEIGAHKLHLGKRTHIMGIVNLTPDSFSGDGLYRATSRSPQATNIIDYAEKMANDGADIIDVGGESSRPGARPIPLKEELKRTAPIIKQLSKKIKIPISIDTVKPEVARQALDNGAVIVNDTRGLRDPKMAKAIKQYKAGIVIMHIKGNPRSMQKNPEYGSLIDEIISYFLESLAIAQQAGIDREKIIIDPGIGFGKTLEHNLEILNRLGEFRIFGRPILVGTSRKSFIGKILGVGPQERVFGTVSSCVLAAKNGAKIVRTHDVKEVRQALEVSDAINNQ